MSMEKHRLYITAPNDRDQAVTILARNGYTVRQGREKQGNKYLWFVEYWREGNGA